MLGSVMGRFVNLKFSENLDNVCLNAEFSGDVKVHNGSLIEKRRTF